MADHGSAAAELTLVRQSMGVVETEILNLLHTQWISLSHFS
jgi:hypothetical protein